MSHCVVSPEILRQIVKPYCEAEQLIMKRHEVLYEDDV